MLRGTSGLVDLRRSPAALTASPTRAIKVSRAPGYVGLASCTHEPSSPAGSRVCVTAPLLSPHSLDGRQVWPLRRGLAYAPSGRWVGFEGFSPALAASRLRGPCGASVHGVAIEGSTEREAPRNTGGGKRLSKDAQKRVVLVLSTALAAFAATRLAGRLLNEPEERGVEDDLKEALVQGTFSVVATVASSYVIRNVLSKHWGT